MVSAVHIAVNRKYHISVILDSEDSDIMLGIDISYVKYTVIVEAVYGCQFSGAFIIFEQSSAGYEGYTSALFAFHHLGMLVRYSQDYLIVYTHIRRIGDLFHGPVIGHDIYTLIRISDGYGLMCLISGHVHSVSASEHIIDAYGGIGTAILVQGNERISVRYNFQLSVSNLRE